MLMVYICLLGEGRCIDFGRAVKLCRHYYSMELQSMHIVSYRLWVGEGRDIQPLMSSPELNRLSVTRDLFYFSRSLPFLI